MPNMAAIPDDLHSLVESSNLEDTLLQKWGDQTYVVNVIKGFANIIRDLKNHQRDHSDHPNNKISSQRLPPATTTTTMAASESNHMSSKLAFTHGKEIADLLRLIEPQPNDDSDGLTVERYNKLDRKHKDALLCFCIFKKTMVLKKRVLIYLWLAQDLIKGDDNVEEAADKILSKLLEDRIIELALRRGKNEKSTSTTYRVVHNPKIRDAIKTRLANLNKEDKHQSHHHGHSNSSSSSSSSGSSDTSSFKVGRLERVAGHLVINDLTDGEDMKSEGSIEGLFNAGVTILNNEAKVRLDKMRSLKWLHLGRWSSNPHQHIEVDVKFLKALKCLKKLRYLSFHGISRIMKLPNSICEIGDLLVLDLRACHNLEVLPKNIGKLKTLVHLDLSKCHLLDHIPKEITYLTQLQVLDGFVISDVKSNSSCTFKDLSKNLGATLRKLSISTREVNFPQEKDLEAFANFDKLLKLRIAWVRVISSVDNDKEETDNVVQETNEDGVLPTTLRKLELRAIPCKVQSRLLKGGSKRLENLKKLYIIGGELSDLSQGNTVSWNVVKTLRLKYLIKLHINWRQFKVIFPQVTSLEVVQCPHLSYFPCDGNGNWTPVEDLDI